MACVAVPSHNLQPQQLLSALHGHCLGVTSHVVDPHNLIARAQDTVRRAAAAALPVPSIGRASGLNGVNAEHLPTWRHAKAKVSCIGHAQSEPENESICLLEIER